MIIISRSSDEFAIHRHWDGVVGPSSDYGELRRKNSDKIPIQGPEILTPSRNYCFFIMARGRDESLYYEEAAGGSSSVQADRAIHVTSDGARVVTGLVNVRPQKRRRAGPGELADTFAEWTPVPDDDLGEVQAVADTVSSLDIEMDEEDTAKRKRYASSVRGVKNLTEQKAKLTWNLPG
jgi:hypothetical protein